MRNRDDLTLDRRNFLKTGAHVAAGAAVLSASAANGAIPTNKRIPLQGGIPEVEFGKTGHRLPILGHGGSAMVERFIRLLPDWGELSRGLNAVVLAPGKFKLDGWYRRGIVAVCAWDRTRRQSHMQE